MKPLVFAVLITNRSGNQSRVDVTLIKSVSLKSDEFQVNRLSYHDAYKYIDVVII